MSTATTVRLLGLRTGRVQTFGPAGQPSAIGKMLVSGPLWLDKLGLQTDEQADQKNHGGLDKALHHYPNEHYANWAVELPDQSHLFHAGGFGENLSTRGLNEENICLGDTFQLGGALIQVSQGRTPCWKLNHRFGVPDMVRRVQNSGRTGWYYRVLTAGTVLPDDTLKLIERPCPAWTIARLFQTLNEKKPDRDALATLAKIDELAPGWREKALQRLSLAA